MFVYCVVAKCSLQPKLSKRDKFTYSVPSLKEVTKVLLECLISCKTISISGIFESIHSSVNKGTLKSVKINVHPLLIASKISVNGGEVPAVKNIVKLPLQKSGIVQNSFNRPDKAFFYVGSPSGLPLFARLRSVFLNQSYVNMFQY